MTGFALDPDHKEIREAVRAFLSKHGTHEQVRRIVDLPDGYDHSGWSRLTGEVGLSAIGIPEQYGGAGAGFAELVVALEELGAALYPSPLFASRVLCASVILLATEESVKQKLLPGLASGELLGTASLPIGEDLAGGRSSSVTATPGPDGYVVDGSRDFVLDAATADLVLVAARTEAGLGIFAVRAGAAGFSVEPQTTLDLTRRQGRIRLSSTPAELIVEPDAAAAVIDSVLDLAAIAQAAEQVGGAARCLDMAVDHARERIQFGRPVGSFQTVKHLCADVLLELDPCRSGVAYAAWALGAEPREAPALASLVKASCSEMYVRAAATCIQVHGGIGFTWEHAAHLYYRRARSSAALFGSVHEHQMRMLMRAGV